MFILLIFEYFELGCTTFEPQNYMGDLSFLTFLLEINHLVLYVPLKPNFIHFCLEIGEKRNNSGVENNSSFILKLMGNTV